jgi:hypothetical protein
MKPLDEFIASTDDNWKRKAVPETTKAPEAMAAKPAPKKSRPPRPSFEAVHAKNIREFTFPDGRKVSLQRHAVNFATPFKEDPDHATLVAAKGGLRPMPLTIAYEDFVAWWKGDANG